MIFHLVNFLLQMGIKVPTVLTYTSTRMMCAAVTALLISIFIGPRFIRKLYELKIGQTVRTGAEVSLAPKLEELHSKKKNTPTMGGILILFSILAAMALWMDWTHPFTLILFMTIIVLGAIGGYDDFLKLKYKNAKGLSSRMKLLIQFALAGVIAIYLLYPPASEWLHRETWYTPPVAKEKISKKKEANEAYRELKVSDYSARVYAPFIKRPLFTFEGLSLLVGALFIMIVIAGSSNAVNLTDGLDGLAAGCLIMAAASLGVIAFVSNNIDIASYLRILYIEGSGEVGIYLSALAGACLGFLWYNSHPAEVFMGDIGSLSLGGSIGVAAVLLKKELLLAIVGGIFVAEALSVILQVGSFKLRNKKRIFLCTPLHHHFEYLGWHEMKVVVRFWIIALLLAIVGVASLKFQ